MYRTLSWIGRLLIVAAVLPLASLSAAPRDAAAAARHTGSATPDAEIIVIDNTPGNRGRIMVKDPYVAPGTIAATWQSPELGWQKVYVGDLNGDGDDEILATQGGVLKAFDPFRPSGAPEVSFEQDLAGQVWQLVATGDLNADGRDEIIATHSLGSSSVLEVYRGNADGTSWTRVRSETFGAGFRRLRTGDINGDGFADFGILRDVDRLVKFWSGRDFSVLYDNTYGSLIWSDLAIGEIAVDSTDKQEIAMVREGASFVLDSFFVVRWNAFNSFSELFLEKQFPNFTLIALGDLNGDGDKEVLLLRSVDASVAELTMRNISGPSMRTFEPAGLGPGWFAVGAGDLDADGRDEPVIVRDGIIRYYTQPEINDTFVDISGSWGASLAIGNVDGSGRTTNPELVVTPQTLTYEADYGGTPPPGQTFVVRNGSDSGNITWSTNIIGGSSWILVSPASGTTGPAGQTVVVTVNPAGLTPNTYQGTIRVAGFLNGSPITGSPKDITVTMVVAAPGLTVSPNSLSFTAEAGGTSPPAQSLSINNTGVPGVVVWTATIIGSAPWLQVSPTNGNTPRTVTVSVSTSGVSPGVHTATIRVAATAPFVTGSPRDIPISLTITAPTMQVSPTSLVWIQERNQTVAPRQVTISQAGGGSGIQWIAGVIPAGTWAEFKEKFENNPAAFTRTDKGWLYQDQEVTQAVDAFDWLQLTPDRGTTPSVMNVSFNSATVPAGLNHVTIVVDGGPDISNRFVGIDVVVLVAEPGHLSQIRLPYIAR